MEELFLEYVRTGDDAYFTKLYPKLKAYYINSFYKTIFINPKYDFEDVCQNAFLKLIISKDKFDPERGRFKPFVYRIFLNTVIDMQIKNKKYYKMVDNYFIHTFK